MLTLRPYKKCDAETIVTWVGDKHAYYQWSANVLPGYPLSPAQLNDYYERETYNDAYWGLTACLDGRPAGHLIMRYPGPARDCLRLGFVILDPALRGQGYGRRLVEQACLFGHHLAGADRITLGVFANNPAAFHCYQAAGFRQLPGKPVPYTLDGQVWPCIEMERRW